jgi:probable HAF family extracellular repeat protein
MTDLGTFGGQYSAASGINNKGQVVGSADTPSDRRAFFYDGVMHDLGFSGQANDINDNSVIVGQSGFSGFLFDGTYHDLGTLGGTYADGRAVNADGLVAGDSTVASGRHHAFLYSDGTMTDLGTLPGGLYSSANGINSAGVVLGNATNSAGHYRAFFYDGAMHDLGPMPGFSESFGTDINSSGLAVGGANSDPYGTVKHAVLYDYANGTVTDLNSLVTNIDGWTLQMAMAINEAGAIVGYGLYDGGNPRAFLLTPIPEPSTVVLLGIGGISSLAYVGRRIR